MCDEINELEVLEESCFLKDDVGEALSYGFIVQLTPEDKMSLSKDDAEQVSAASNLLEFHNQQVLIPNHTVSDNLPPSPMVDVKVSVHGTTVVKREVCSSETAEFVLRPVRSIMREYGRKPITTVKVEVTDESTSKQKVPVVQTTFPVKLVSKKKRRLLIDTLKAIPNAEFKQQLNNTKDIVITGELAPATKKAMHQLTYCGVGKFFAYPGRKILSGPLSQIFFSHLTVRTEPQLVQGGELEPLSPDLKTANNVMQSFSCTLQPHSADYSQLSPAFSETLAKRTANSFDQYIKGFTNQKFRRSRNLKEFRDTQKKQSMVAEYTASCLQPREVLISGLDCSPPPSPGTEVITSDPLQPGSPMSMETEHPFEADTRLETETHLGTGTPLETDSPLETENSDYSISMVDKDDEELTNANELYFINGNSEDATAAQSNIEILLSAAERGVGSSTSPGASHLELPGECGELQLQCSNNEEVVEEVDSKQIMYCTAESEEDGTFIIVDATGKRYKVSQHSVGLALWPEPAKAID